MIIYSATKLEFCSHVKANQIETILFNNTLEKAGRRTPQAEVRSWQNSLQYMLNILQDVELPEDALIAIEYKIPRTSNRIDFVISGLNEEKKESLVIVELKQWEKASKTSMDGIVTAWIGGSNREVPHPSYQAWSYAALLEDFNSVVDENKIGLHPCSYLHNCKIPGDLDDSFYESYTTKAPIFFRDDSEKLAAFIKKHVRFGDTDGILYRVDNGKIRPSKNLADQLSSMLKGKEEFILIDDQKVVFEKAIEYAEISQAKNKNVMIVEGGPGSGKSVVAVNLLVKMTELGKTAQYVTKNAAPRAVYEQKLTGIMTKSRISNLFVGSGAFHSSDRNSFDSLIVDEAHRLNQKSGLFSNLGENQVKEIIESSLFSIFFIDEDQRVTFKDIGTKEEIIKWAKKSGALVHQLKLHSQFRCNGSEGYLSWLDHSLQVRETGNENLTEVSYDFQVFDSPELMHEKIKDHNKINNKSRIVAGYCWEWPSKKNSKTHDIDIEGFQIKWNLTMHGSAWIIQQDSVNEAGCIHTCQGLELDYVGVIIGPDLIVRDGRVITDGLKRAKSDQSIRGFKGLYKKDPIKASAKVDPIIKNTYRTLMTRGMKGCYLYCTDKETREYFKGFSK